MASNYVKYWWGIDPGAKGCICSLDEKNNVGFYPIEKISGKVINLAEIANWICDRVFPYGDKEPEYILEHVVLEDVHSIFGSSAKSNFQFGWINGALEGILSTFKVPYTKVAPKMWQKELWTGVKPVLKRGKDGKSIVDVKGTSLIAAKRLYPNVDFRRTPKCKNDDDNLVDALMMATFAKRKY